MAKFFDKYKDFDEMKQNNYEMNTYTGTIAFRPPETFCSASYDETVDMWAAGCVLYTMLCGYQPFYCQL